MDNYIVMSLINKITLFTLKTASLTTTASQNMTSGFELIMAVHNLKQIFTEMALWLLLSVPNFHITRIRNISTIEVRLPSHSNYYLIP